MIHATGLRHLAAVEQEMRVITARSFAGEDVPALLRRIRTEPRYTFSSREEILEAARAAERRARERLAPWFGRVPRAELVVRPVAPFQERTALVSYVTAAADGSRPGTIFVNPSEPERQGRATLNASPTRWGCTRPTWSGSGCCRGRRSAPPDSWSTAASMSWAGPSSRPPTSSWRARR